MHPQLYSAEDLPLSSRDRSGDTKEEEEEVYNYYSDQEDHLEGDEEFDSDEFDDDEMSVSYDDLR